MSKKPTKFRNGVRTRHISNFSDKELADMVRESIYVQGEKFGPHNNRFLVVLAVPYSPEVDDVRTAAEALDAFAALLQDEDWRQRSFEVYDYATGQYSTTSREELG